MHQLAAKGDPDRCFGEGSAGRAGCLELKISADNCKNLARFPSGSCTLVPGKPGTADPNAPSGASTAAPYFVARRLLQLIAFCELQMIDLSFDVCVVVCV